jgi:tricorn protease
MFRFVCFITAVLLAPSVSLAADGRLLHHPDIHGSTIVFTYENDLWSVPSAGGTATRLTSHPGNEYAAHFSPDGAQIAFTGQYDGASSSVYVMKSTGGIPNRLTYMPGTTMSLGWTPDGKRVIFRSTFENVIYRTPKLYTVDLEGSLPQRLPPDRGTLCSFSADGKSLLYSRKGSEEYYWKRYKGGEYPDIWRYDFASNNYTKISDYVGKSTYPMWVGNSMYFVSDRVNGISNLFVQDLATLTVTPVTSYADFDVMTPSTDGKSIVFTQNGYLHVLDIATGKDSRIPVTVPSDRWTTRTRTIDAKDYIHTVDIANDGKQALAEVRGDLFSLTLEKKVSTNLSMNCGTREMYPAISPDGKTVAFFSDKTGEYQIYTQPVAGGAWTQITTTLDRTPYRLLWSPDGKKILFGDKDFRIFVLDVATRKLTKVDESNQAKNDEFYWMINDYTWSPDSRWIAYSFVQSNRNSQIFIYSLDQNTKTAVTNDFFDNLYPAFDMNGKYLYFVSSRNFDVQMDFYEDNHVYSNPQQIMAVQLRAGEAPPFADPLTQVTKEETEKGGQEAFRIDIRDIVTRVTPLPVPAGNYFYLRAGKGKVLWASVPKFTEDEYEEIFKPGGETKWDLHIFDVEHKKETVLGDKIQDFALSANREQLLIHKEGDYFGTTVSKAFESKNAGDKISFGVLAYTVDNIAEWTQIFNDAWRWYRDFFYDANMHGRDWRKMGDTYRAYIPDLSSRDELNWLLSQMVGELCVSHTYIGGGDVVSLKPPASAVYTGWLGADIVPDMASGYYTFSRIYGPTEYHTNYTGPLVRPDIDLKEGGYLIAINGVEVKPPADYHRLLQVTSGQKIEITVNAKPTRDGARTYTISPIRYDPNLRYIRWVADNIDHVLKATDGKVGYMHITAMGSGGIGEFDKFWRAFRYKEGLIIDVRRNSGGWTEYFLIDKLERKMTSYNTLKGKVPFRYPGSTSNAHLVAISNEYNGSDGEAFIEDFKANKLGTVVGVPSWGGLVGILNRQTTVDNGAVEQSNNAFYGEKGTWLVENHGADPDVLMDNDPASVAAGKDAQLDKAIETVLKQIREKPFTFPPQPPYPKK